MSRYILIVLFTAMILIAAGCAKTGRKDPVSRTISKKLGLKTFSSPKFKNGNIVRQKLIADKYGIVMYANYSYAPDLNAWYCIVDFYPPSLLGLNFFGFEGYERRYLYEFELESVPKKRNQTREYARWHHMSMTTQ